MNTAKRRRVHRHGIPRQANKLFFWLFLIGSALLAVFEVATNRIGFLFIQSLARHLIEKGQIENYEFWGNILSYAVGFVPLLFLVYMWFKYASGHYERRQEIHTEKLKNEFDQARDPDSWINDLLHWLGIIIPGFIVFYGASMDWLGVYSFFGHPSWDTDRTLFIIFGVLGVGAACLSTWGVPNLFFTAWDMKDEAQIQRRRHTVDLQNQTPVPEPPGLLTRFASVGSGKQLAAPSGKKSQTTTI